ncbi:hypothetical protein HK100_008801 [Physocladia obscura]|uniref:Uncharacterized protein n=1 Tax=Physocladia obscura TaxID=109957 RepID=A0AAD5SP64_9FUNG|nr:hypothetical protein HK100_008801 [Physocladia obscura]
MFPAIINEQQKGLIKPDAINSKKQHFLENTSSDSQEIAKAVAEKQIPSIHAYQFHNYDPSKDPLLIRKQPILRPLVDFKSLEFHRNWPLEYLSLRLQKEREKELETFKSLFQLRVNNPYVADCELELRQKQTRGKQHHFDSDNTVHKHKNKHPHPYHPHPPHHNHPDLENNSSNEHHILQQKLVTRYQKYRHLIHPPQHPTNPAPLHPDAAVFSRLAAPISHTNCNHIQSDQSCLSWSEDGTKIIRSGGISPESLARLAAPKMRSKTPGQQPQPHPSGNPPRRVSSAAIARLAAPRVVHPVFVPEDTAAIAAAWKPMTNRIVLSDASYARLLQISRPRNWQEIEDTRRMATGYQPVNDEVSAAANNSKQSQQASASNTQDGTQVGENGLEVPDVESSKAVVNGSSDSNEVVTVFDNASDQNDDLPEKLEQNIAAEASAEQQAPQNLEISEQQQQQSQLEKGGDSTNGDNSQDPSDILAITANDATASEIGAAITLQATFRGFQARKKSRASQDKLHDENTPHINQAAAAADQSEETNTSNGSKQPEQEQSRDETLLPENDILAIQPQTATESEINAAVILQATFRGFQARKKLKDSFDELNTSTENSAANKHQDAETNHSQEGKEEAPVLLTTEKNDENTAAAEASDSTSNQEKIAEQEIVLSITSKAAAESEVNAAITLQANFREFEQTREKSKDSLNELNSSNPDEEAGSGKILEDESNS